MSLVALRGALGQLAHLVGDDGEAQPRLARARRLDGGVEGEQVRLGCDVLDGVDDLRDLERAVGQGLDLLGDRLRPRPGSAACRSGCCAPPARPSRTPPADGRPPRRTRRRSSPPGARTPSAPPSTPVMPMASRDCAWAPPPSARMDAIISLALERTWSAAWRTSLMMVPISSTITLMASTTLPSTSEVTSPRFVRSPWAISVAVSRNG